MSALDEDVARVREHIRATIGSEPEQWTKWPGGWRGDIESALIDAVFSARAIYETEGGRGISRHLADWQAARTRSTFSLDALLTEINAAGISGWSSRPKLRGLGAGISFLTRQASLPAASGRSQECVGVSPGMAAVAC